MKNKSEPSKQEIRGLVWGVFALGCSSLISGLSKMSIDGNIVFGIGLGICLFALLLNAGLPYLFKNKG